MARLSPTPSHPPPLVHRPYNRESITRDKWGSPKLYVVLALIGSFLLFIAFFYLIFFIWTKVSSTSPLFDIPAEPGAQPESAPQIDELEMQPIEEEEEEEGEGEEEEQEGDLEQLMVEAQIPADWVAWSWWWRGVRAPVATFFLFFVFLSIGVSLKYNDVVDNIRRSYLVRQFTGVCSVLANVNKNI